MFSWNSCAQRSHACEYLLILGCGFCVWGSGCVCVLLLLLSLFELLWLTPHFIYIKNICIFLPYIIYQKYFSQIFTLRWGYSKARTQYTRCVHICCWYTQDKKKNSDRTHILRTYISKRMSGFGIWRILRFFPWASSHVLHSPWLFLLSLSHSHSISHFPHTFFVRL